MRSITKRKTLDEIQQYLKGFDHVYILGCGTCTTMTRTGGKDQVLEMRDYLEGLEKTITGWTVIPIACDEMTEVAMKENERPIRNAGCVLVMACALGVHRISTYTNNPVIPALDTLFIGLEEKPGHFREVCIQCGQCVLGETAGICPVSECNKGLLNGPCGGTNDGKCEVDKEKDCAWTLIYRRLKLQGRLDLMRKYHPPKNYQTAPRPKSVRIRTSEENQDGSV
ncbi:MAG: 5,10-methylenetetrahydrofolate reductase [Ammonifex sp.]|jgi:ferredoxin|nr:MAG: 5,10-methylenetetrahydrofolate reductase [Ammonifex sp.]